MDMPYDIRLTYKKVDIQLPGNLTDDSVILNTVQLPVKNHLFLYVSSDYLSIYLSSNTAYALTSIFGRHCASGL